MESKCESAEEFEQQLPGKNWEAIIKVKPDG